MKIGLLVGNAGRNSGGPEIYETNLLRSLLSLDHSNEYHVYCLDRRAPDVVGIRKENLQYHQLWPKYRPVSLLTSLPWKMLRHRVDVFHATFVPPPLALRNYIFTLVCFGMFRHPEFYPPPIRIRVQALMRLGARNAGRFLCVSKNVRDHYAERFHIPEDRLAVVYMGKSEIFHPIDDGEKRRFLKETYGIDQPYFLFSGRWEKRKNILGILEAFARVKEEAQIPHKLVLTGSRTWAAREAESLIERLGLHPHIVDVGKSPISHLPYLYGGADALVYASFWEGFGMPIIEAMACGTPVITSNVSSMPEVAGDSALLVDPYSIEDIASAMYELAVNPMHRAQLSAKGLARATQFSWEITAQRTLSEYGRFLTVNSPNRKII
ncbi:MAG TPA: glycosyltransferase family 1 protein [Terriglobia bacterium]|nr:glycosyltransferase family 1 protein [Terriglobia bacterium]